MNADRLNLRVTNRLTEIARLADRVRAFCAEHGVSEAIAFRINLALEEVLANTIKYGYADDVAHEIAVELQQTRDGLTVEIDDDARPFDPTQAATPDLSAPLEERSIGGLGIHFVRTMMDEVRYRRDGGRNRLTLVKRLTSGGGAPTR